MTPRAWWSLIVFGWWLLVTVLAVDAAWRGVPSLNVAVFVAGGYSLPLVLRWMAAAQERWETGR